MRGWYNIHDHTNKRMGFVTFTGSPKSDPVAMTSMPTQPFPLVDVVERFRIFGIDAYYFLIIVLLVGLCTCCSVYYILVNCYGLFGAAKFLKRFNKKDEVAAPESQLTLIYLPE